MDPRMKYTPDRHWAGAVRNINARMNHVFAHWTPSGTLVSTAFFDSDEEYAKTSGVLAWYDANNAKIVLNTRAIVELVSPKHKGRMVGVRSKELALIVTSALTKNSTSNYAPYYTADWKPIVNQVLGLVSHESAHTRWTNWTGHPELIGASEDVVRIMRMFEELRVEQLAIDHEGRHNATLSPRDLLPAMYSLVLMQLRDVTIENTGTLAYVWALTHGRAISGVVNPSVVDDIDSAVRSELSDDVVDYLDELLEQAIVTDTTRSIGVRTLRELAEDWLAQVGAPGSEDADGEGDSGAPSCGCGAGDPQPGDGDDNDNEDGESDAASKGAGDDGDESGDSSRSPSTGDTGNDDPDDEEKEASGSYDDTISHGYGGHVSPALEHIIHEILNEEEFDWVQISDTNREMGDPKVFAPQVFGGRRTELHKRKGFSKRPPSPEVRQAVTTLTQQFEKVSLPQVAKTPTRLALPPGRLNTREAVRRSAERSRGMIVTAKPWLGEKRRHTTAKPLVIGLATDVSGSMAWAEEMVADASYTFAHAGHRIGARVASVSFGSTAEGIVMPGELPRDVIQRQSNGGFEAFDDAAAALEGVLHLGVDDDSAKFVTIISDAQLVRDGEPAIATKWLERWNRAGTHILWVGFTGGDYYGSWLEDCKGVTYVDIDRSSVRYDNLALVRAIGPSLLKAMRPGSE